MTLAGAEERRFYEITLPEIKRFIGKVGDEEVKSILSGTTKPEGEARKLAFQKLVREALPTHLREIKPVGPDGIPNLWPESASDIWDALGKGLLPASDPKVSSLWQLLPRLRSTAESDE